MRSADIGILQQLAAAAEGWHSSASAVGVEIARIDVTINGQPVTLNWAPGDGGNPGSWEITAS